MTRRRTVKYNDIATAVSANLLAAIVIRNEHVINLIFMMSCSLPYRSPLLLRRLFAKVYGYGGLHSGCGVAAVAWYVCFAALVTRAFVRSELEERFILAITWLILALLIAIIVCAYRRLRAALHSYLELVHRFAGWTVVALFWIQTIAIAVVDRKPRGSSTGQMLVATPTFWFLLIITACIIYLWARLRPGTVRAEYLSDHAVRIHFDHGTVDSCMAIRLSDNPLKENHAFAVIPEPDEQAGFSIVVSNAGDWTKRLIQNPPTRLWVKGVPAWGVLRVATMFSPVVIVASGSGIGPCLGFFNGSSSPSCRVFWSTRCPEETYGKAIMDTVLKADPNAVIIDTQVSGRPDMIALTYKLYKEAAAEAVVVISNPKLTKKLVHGMETRGVPAYGPIWDS